MMRRMERWVRWLAVKYPRWLPGGRLARCYVAGWIDMGLDTTRELERKRRKLSWLEEKVYMAGMRVAAWEERKV